MWILSFIWYVEFYEIQIIYKLLFLGTTEAYDGTGRWDFLHNGHFSFIPSLSVVYKPGSSHPTTKNDKNMAPIWMRDKTIPDPFQSKNIQEFFSFLCRISNLIAQCPPFNSFVDLSITMLIEVYLTNVL